MGELEVTGEREGGGVGGSTPHSRRRCRPAARVERAGGRGGGVARRRRRCRRPSPAPRPSVAGRRPLPSLPLPRSAGRGAQTGVDAARRRPPRPPRAAAAVCHSRPAGWRCCRPPTQAAGAPHPGGAAGRPAGCSGRRFSALALLPATHPGGRGALPRRQRPTPFPALPLSAARRHPPPHHTAGVAPTVACTAAAHPRRLFFFFFFLHLDLAVFVSLPRFVFCLFFFFESSTAQPCLPGG